jgi:glycosyltransferase involved in cell wall biosynthesis
LSKTDDSIDWAKKLQKLITNSKLRIKLSENGYKKSAKIFSWETSVKAHQKLFEKLANG